MKIDVSKASNRLRAMRKQVREIIARREAAEDWDVLSKLSTAIVHLVRVNAFDGRTYIVRPHKDMHTKLIIEAYGMGYFTRGARGVDKAVALETLEVVRDVFESSSKPVIAAYSAFVEGEESRPYRMSRAGWENGRQDGVFLPRNPRKMKHLRRKLGAQHLAPFSRSVSDLRRAREAQEIIEAALAYVPPITMPTSNAAVELMDPAVEVRDEGPHAPL